MIKIIFADLDGTILNDNKKITEYTMDSINYAMEKGIEFVPTTGRHKGGIPDIILKNSSIKYAVTVNGAAIWELHPNEICLKTDRLPTEIVLKIMQKSLELDVMADIFSDEKCYTDYRNIEILKEVDVSEPVKKYILSSRTVTDNLMDFYTKSKPEINKITMNFKGVKNSTPKNRNKMIEYLKGIREISVVSGGGDNIEVTSSTATKGSGVKWIADYLNIPLSDTIAFGDSENDLSMFEVCGHSCAPENSAKELKEISEYLCQENNDDGIAKFIDKITGRMR